LTFATSKKTDVINDARPMMPHVTINANASEFVVSKIVRVARTVWAGATAPGMFRTTSAPSPTLTTTVWFIGDPKHCAVKTIANRSGTVVLACVLMVMQIVSWIVNPMAKGVSLIAHAINTV
jgi:hypothetical protein